jgi:hypothetical protein
MKFFGEPNLYVTDSKNNGRVLFKFDENGEYATDDEKLINRLKHHFKHEEQTEEKEVPAPKRETVSETKLEVKPEKRQTKTAKRKTTSRRAKK